nr:MAG TPA: cell division protein [Caudoviricetes sp.]
MDIEKLIERLKNLEACAYGYHINGEVLGMDCSDFEQIMVDAVDEISKVPTFQAENERLRDELDEKEKYYDQMIDALAATDRTELDQMKRENEALKHALQNWHEEV